MVKLIIVLLLTSCSDLILNEPPPQDFLELYMSTYQNENGYYLVDYPDLANNSYTTVYYKTLPDTRVFWTSPDSFTVYHWGQTITEPIVNYSTFSNSDSTGQQIIYLYQEFIDDTLTIVGYVNDNIITTLDFIVY